MQRLVLVNVLVFIITGLGISIFKETNKHIDLEKGFDYVNVVSMDLMKFIMKKMTPSFLYDKYKKYST